MFSLCLLIFFNNFIYLFIYGCAGSSLLCGFSLVVESEGSLVAAMLRLLIVVSSPVAEHWL